MGRIEEFTEKEKQKSSWLRKLSANYPVVTGTSLLVRGNTVPTNSTEKIIRPSLLKRILYFMAFLGASFGWLSLVILGREKGMPWEVYIVLIPFLIFASISFLLVIFLKGYSYRIRINKSGITVREDFTSWDDITGTAIMRKPQGRGDQRFLVIFKRDGTDLKWDLHLFGISDRKLAATIEYFKNS